MWFTKKGQKIVVIHFPTVDTKVNQPCRSRSVQALAKLLPFCFKGTLWPQTSVSFLSVIALELERGGWGQVRTVDNAQLLTGDILGADFAWAPGGLWMGQTSRPHVFILRMQSLRLICSVF